MRKTCTTIILLLIIISTSIFILHLISLRRNNYKIFEIKPLDNNINNDLTKTNNMIDYISYSVQNHQAGTQLKIEAKINNDSLIESDQKDNITEISIKITSALEDGALILFEKKAELTQKEWSKLIDNVKNNEETESSVSVANLPKTEPVITHNEEDIRYTAYEAGKAIKLKPEYDLGSYLMELAENKLDFHYYDGLAKFEVDGLYGYMNGIYRVVIKPQYLTASDFSQGKAKVTGPNGKMVTINTSGEIIEN